MLLLPSLFRLYFRISSQVLQWVKWSKNFQNLHGYVNTLSDSYLLRNYFRSILNSLWFDLKIFHSFIKELIKEHLIKKFQS